MNLLDGLKINPSPHDHFQTNPDHTLILHLARKLQREGIKYDLHKCYEGWQLVFWHNGYRADIVQHNSSYGLESYGFPEDGNDVTGNLTISQAIARINRFYGMEEKIMEKWWESPTAALGALCGEKAEEELRVALQESAKAEYQRGYEDACDALRGTAEVKNAYKCNAWFGECGACGCHVVRMPYCPRCGRRLNWEDKHETD